jgi:GNAT superfamily N-acetyltransferase
MNRRGLGRIHFIDLWQSTVKMCRTHRLGTTTFMGQTSPFDLLPRIIELTADATWPAEERIALGPWLLRATGGYSNRANSVRTAPQAPSVSSDVSWLDLIASAENLYQQRNLPATFHISPATAPDDLDAVLTTRGYAVLNSSEVWSLALKPVASRHRLSAPGDIKLCVDPSSDWLNCALDESIGRAKIREQICLRIPAPRAFASGIDQSRTVARALAAISGQIAWLYCMATEPTHQRRGFATALLSNLFDWSIDNGARVMCLQVLAGNKPARSLYAKRGFQKRYDYHYRVLRRAGVAF